MDQVPSWLLYGAYGYTGRRIAEEACRRGMRPVLAGRDAAKVQSLAARLQCPKRVFSLDSPEGIAGHLADVRAVLHCAGPFSETARPMIDACLTARVHYLDITGEIDVIEAAAGRHEEARAAGVTLLPAVGFDVVPSDCLAAMLAQRLPGATHLELAFEAFGPPSRGTARTMLEALPRGGRVRVDGRIVTVPPGWKTMEVPFRHGKRWAVTVPWGDVASAYHSTGIANIEVYVGVPRWQTHELRLMRPLLPVLRGRWAQRWLRSLVDRFVHGPSDRQQQAGRGSFWGRVRDAEGRAVSATLETPAGYVLTVLTALASLEKVLAGVAPTGFATPSRAFGAEFVLGIPGSDFRWETTAG